MLYLVSTPIGHLGDFSFRAVETLKNVEEILCEDTRHSRRLLNHYEIQGNLKSFHLFNEAQREEEVLERLRNGADIALISDAGTPGIADPGARLVARCQEEGLEVSAIPGPCAAIQALVCSGLDTTRFQFLGFLPKKEGQRRSLLQDALSYPGTSIVYESPKRLIKTLGAIDALVSDALCVVARELTKVYEEISRGTASELIKSWDEREVRGEIVLLISGGHSLEKEVTDLTIAEQVLRAQEKQGLSQKEAIKWVSTQTGVPKRTVYREIHRLEGEESP